MLLDKILEVKRKSIPVKIGFLERGRGLRKIDDFLGGGVNIIAELKERSPSRGFIKHLDIDVVVPVYNRYACGISVLTDEYFFGGGFDLLRRVASMVEVPVLCKDFVIDESQIRAAYLSGADLVLLIARVLGGNGLKELYECVRDFGMEALVEVHSQKDLDVVCELKPHVVGVNSRDLDTLSVDIGRARDLLREITWDCVRIAESGIKTAEDVRVFRGLCDAYLVGEGLLTSGDVEVKFRELISA